MADEVAYHIPVNEPPRKVAQLNFFQRLMESQNPLPKPKPQPAPKPAPKPPPKPKPAPAPAKAAPAPPKRRPAARQSAGRDRQTAILGSLAILLAGAGTLAAVFHNHRQHPIIGLEANIPTATPRATPTPQVPPTAVPIAAPTPAAAAPSTNRYTVQPGDSLVSIAEKLGKDWQAIAAANGSITNPSLIFAGQVLIIP
jgi:nucleoid-associated protein YgaU